MKKQTTVLLADDEPLIIDLLSFELGQAGFRVLQAKNGKDALDLCIRDDIDLLISDINMPDTGGFKLVKKLRASDKGQIPILFITGFAAHELIEISDLGAVEVLSKPFEPATLINKIKQILKNQRENPDDY